MMKMIVTKCFIGGINIVFPKSHDIAKKAIFLPAVEIRSYCSTQPKIDYNINQLTKSMAMLSPTGKKVSLENSEPNVEVGRAKSLKLSPYLNEKQPLVVMLPWLGSQPKQYNKYAEIYLKLGFDVLTVAVSTKHVWRPSIGSQIVAKDLLGFLENNNSFSPLLIHGFSVGGYLWGEVLTYLNQDRERYSNLMNRITGHIWDSYVDVRDAFAGYPYAMFPTNPIFRKAFESYLRYHFKANYETVEKRFVEGCKSFHMSNSKAPALFLVSTNDNIGTIQNNTAVRERWESLGVTTYMKVWNDSPHVKHYIYHPEEYVAEIDAFLSKIQLLPSFNTIQASVSCIT